MNLSKKTLENMNKEDLINIILDIQNNNNIEEFKDIKLFFKKNFNSNYENTKEYGYTVVIRSNILYVSWKKYVPSGYSDNGIGGNFEITLTKQQINKINKNGFTSNVILPIIKNKCNQSTEELLSA